MRFVRSSRCLRVCAAAVIFGILAGGWILYGLERANDAGVQVTTASPASAQVIDQSAITAAAKQAMPSVVAVASTKTVKFRSFPGPFFDDPWFRRFFGNMPDQEREYSQRGLGSGVIVSQDGYILTNNHVIADADEIEIHLYDERVMKAEVVGTDEASELAVLKIKADDLPVLAMADSDKAEVGEIVLAIGSPFGLGNTVTMGIISAKDRTDLGITGETGYEDFIQTDAAINPGNSGGALINLKGELVGINTAIATYTRGYQGVGFAIPTNLARRVMDSLVKHGELVRGWLGVGIQDIDAELAEQFGLENTKGVVISSVEDDSPAQAAGLKVGDVILKVNGKAVDTPNALRSVIGTTAPGTEVAIEIITGGEHKTLTVRIAEARKDVAKAPLGLPGVEGDVEILAGIWASDLTAELRASMELADNAKGIVITRTDEQKIQSRMPLQAGDLILAVNQKAVASVEQAQKLINASKRDTVLLLVQRGRYTIFTTVKK